MQRRLRKVKLATGKPLVIAYDVLHNETWDRVTIESSDEPEPELGEHMAALTVDVAIWCDLPNGCFADVTVQAVTMAYAADGTMGASISALRALDTCDSPLVLNTPYKPESSERPDAPTITVGCRDRLDALELAAWRFVDGHRLQMQLAFGVGEEGEA